MARHTSRTTPLARIGLLVLMFATAAPAADGLSIDHARIPAPPAGAPVLAGYVDLTNPTDEAIRITGAASPAFGRIELHESLVDDGTTRMARREYVEVTANDRLSLAPRGLHLMLFAPAREFAAGDTIDIRIHTTAGDIEVGFAVIEAMQVERHGGHDH